jgi:hypothetical protein
MKKTVLTFGLISGVVISVLMLSTLPFAHQIGFSRAMIVGYTTMVLSFLLVFFGIRSYRENVGNGRISFGRAMGVGLLIMLISCAFYVITWEFMYFFLMPNFLTEYSAYMVENMRASGASAEQINQQVEQMKQFQVLYSNPFINAAFTLLEPLPVGLVMTLISALILRTRKPKESLGTGLPDLQN